MADNPAEPTEQKTAAAPATGEGPGDPRAPTEQEAANKSAQVRETASKLNKGLETFAGTINNFQTVLTLVGAVFGALAFLNLELGLLAALNTLFHNVAAIVYRAKVPLVIGLVLLAGLNLVWLLRQRRSGASARGRTRWLSIAVALALAAGIWLVKPVPYDVAVLTYAPAPTGAVTGSETSLGTQLASLLAQEMEAGNAMVKAVLASQVDRSEAGLQALGEEKGVDFVVSGAFTLAGPNVQLNANVYDVRASKYLLDQPIEKFDLRDNAPNLQAETAAQIIAALPLYSGARVAEANKTAETCSSAYECYLRGRQYYRWYNRAGYEQAIAAYNKALEWEPNYGLAFAGLADAQTFLAAESTFTGDYDRSHELQVQAAESARKALELEPESLESLRAAAFLYVVRDFPEQAAALVHRIAALAPDDAETHWLRGLTALTANEQLEHFQRAVELAPTLTIARQFLGSQLFEMGRPEEALPHLQAAIQQNPYQLRAYETLGWSLLALNQPLEAEAQARTILQLEPRYVAAQTLLSFALAAQGSTVEAMQIAQQALAAAPEQGLYDSRQSYARQADYAPIISFFESLRNQQPDFVYVANHLGNLYRNAGRIDEAEASYREALRRDPSLAVAHYNLAELLAQERGDLGQAEPEAAKAVEGLPDLPAAHSLHGNILRQMQRYAGAETALRAAQALSPQSPWPHFDLGGLYLDMNQVEKAEAEFDLARAMEPDEAYAYNAWANLLFEREQYPQAAAYYQEAIARSPDNSLLYSNLADAQRQSGATDSAWQSCQAAIDLAPETNPDAYRVCGKIMLARGDYQAAEELLRHGLSAIPTSSALHLLLAGLLDQAGRYAEADAAFQAAVDFDTRGITALNDWANALDARGEIEAAVDKYEQAIARYPNDTALLANLADSYRQQGRLDDALARVQKALQIQSDDAWAHNVWGDILFDQQRYDQAQERYLEAIRLQPDQASYHRDLAQLYVKIERLDAAENAFAEAVAADPRDPLSYNDWGLYLYEQGRFDEAIAKFQEALRLMPDSAAFLTNIGDAYWKQEQYAEAEPWYEQALAIAPDDDYALASLGLVLWLQDQPEPAIDKLTAAIAIDSQVLWYYTTLAYAQIEAGDLGGAQETVDQAMMLAPDDSEVQNLQAILAEQNPQD